MSSSDSQPPLTRRQARERERAAETGALPVAPPSAVPASAPAQQSAVRTEGARGVTVPSAPAATPTDLPRRRPGSHVAPAVAAPAQAAAVQPAAVQPDRAPSDLPPASATEIVPGTGMTRRQLRALREAEGRTPTNPIPLQAPSPQSSDRTVQDVLGDVAALEGQRIAAEPEPDAAALEQATVADGSPDAIEPLAEAAAHGEEPRLHRSTWAAPDAEHDAPLAEAEPVVDVVPVGHGRPVGTDRDHGVTDDPHADVLVPADRGDAPSDGAGAGPERAAQRGDDRAGEQVTGATTIGADGVSAPATDASDADGIEVDDLLNVPVPPASEPSVFPLDLDGGAVVPAQADGSAAAVPPGRAAAPDTGAGAVATDPGTADIGSAATAVPAGVDGAEPTSGSSLPAPSSAARTDDPAPSVVPEPDADAAVGPRRTGTVRTEPPATTGSLTPPAGHWTRQAQAQDEHVHDTETGQFRATQSQPNALIMPNSALSDVTGALNATGEVIITGSIDLPKALASTGAHTSNIDGAEIDRLLEQHDAEGAATNDAVPVRASRAVSSHTSTRAVVLAAAKPKQSKVPVVLSVSAASVGVAGVIVMVVSFFALGIW